MRPPRVAILVFFSVAFLFLVGRSLIASTQSATYSQQPGVSIPRRSVWNFMYYNTPFSLFPANAAISLTDDNSTSFAARPAAFGPKLAELGLSGQLWVGSGFAEDSLEGNGELGCSDLPGWNGGNARAAASKGPSKATTSSRISGTGGKADPPKRGDEFLDSPDRDSIVKAKKLSRRSVDDGTDDYLSQNLAESLARRDASASSSHADIQSIQEAAEIQGKVVLLMRGGCGFLEKVMWAQRRGAIAVIVGDNQKGGPLIQMFAHGDEVENVTVPSVFTARTTAHLLSSLTQPGSFIEDTLDDNGNPVLKVQRGTKPKAKHVGSEKQPARHLDSSKAPVPVMEKRSVQEQHDAQKSSNSDHGWFARLFSWGRSSGSGSGKSRPPSSGRLDWVLVDDWSDEEDNLIKDGIRSKNKDNSKNVPQKQFAADDEFVIGVQDWRDPDLLKKSGSDKLVADVSGSKTNQKASSGLSSGNDYVKSPADTSRPKGGSITPGSGEYDPDQAISEHAKDVSQTSAAPSSQGGKGQGLMSRLFGGGEDDKDLDVETSPGGPVGDGDDGEQPKLPDVPRSDRHEGLWVTITPTSSASPFFDTLLVLVISPLVTLTVVYALLILRAKIRRRRWRAPKSVVERLPVRTYHTVATSRSPSPRLPSPSSASPTTPLLQANHSRSRPRSRTTTGVIESENFLAPSSAIPTTPGSSQRRSRAEQVEKGAGGFSAEWRKYMGRQVECVVCLEEYVDGVSRVMSLPCGHEFHVDCITPWLTTRRRTCPICKGDVVRSLARGSRSGPRYEPYRDDSDDDEAEGSGQHGAGAEDADLEQGILSPGRQSNRSNRWLSLISANFGSRPEPNSHPSSPTRSRSPSPRPEGRPR